MVDERGLVISGINLDGVDGLFGLHQAVPEGASFGVRAGAEGAASPSEITWRLEAASAEETPAILAAQQQALARGQAGLDDAARVLERMARQTGERSFGLEAGPEAELMAAVRQAEAGVYSYSTAEVEERRGLGEQWQNLVAQVQRLVVDYARVETVVAGQRIGETRVDWSGDFETIWNPGVGVELLQVHSRSVRTALAARFALVRLVGVVVTGAAALGMRATLPGGAVLLLPAVWKYVRDVLQAWKQMKEVG